jgi:hypothetical protein
MSNGLTTFLSEMIPLYVLMFSPALVPIVGWLVGTLHDRTRARRQQHRR